MLSVSGTKRHSATRGSAPSTVDRRRLGTAASFSDAVKSMLSRPPDAPRSASEKV